MERWWRGSRPKHKLGLAGRKSQEPIPFLGFSLNDRFLGNPRGETKAEPSPDRVAFQSLPREPCGLLPRGGRDDTRTSREDHRSPQWPGTLARPIGFSRHRLRMRLRSCSLACLPRLVAGDSPGMPTDLMASRSSSWAEQLGGSSCWWPVTFDLTEAGVQALADAFCSEKECWKVFREMVEETIPEMRAINEDRGRKLLGPGCRSGWPP